MMKESIDKSLTSGNNILFKNCCKTEKIKSQNLKCKTINCSAFIRNIKTNGSFKIKNNMSKCRYLSTSAFLNLFIYRAAYFYSQ